MAGLGVGTRVGGGRSVGARVGGAVGGGIEVGWGGGGGTVGGTRVNVGRTIGADVLVALGLASATRSVVRQPRITNHASRAARISLCMRDNLVTPRPCRRDERWKMRDERFSPSSVICHLFSMVPLDLESIQLHGFGGIGDVGFVDARVM